MQKMKLKKYLHRKKKDSYSDGSRMMDQVKNVSITLQLPTNDKKQLSQSVLCLLPRKQKLPFLNDCKTHELVRIRKLKDKLQKLRHALEKEQKKKKNWIKQCNAFLNIKSVELIKLY